MTNFRRVAEKFKLSVAPRGGRVWTWLALMLAVMSVAFYSGLRAADYAHSTSITATADEDLGALAVRVAQLQAQLIRLEALGRRLAERAGLDKTEFDFDSSPGQGGPPDATMFPRPISSVEFDNWLADLTVHVQDREQKLAVLESMVLSRELHEEVYPAGQPVSNGYLSSHFGHRVDPFTGHSAFHAGVDIAGREGEAVNAVAAGVVVFVGEQNGYGRLVEIDHGNGYVTRYAHNRALTVSLGQRVDKGQRIALLGSTGRSTGPHLHFEVLHQGKVVNPARFLTAAR